MAAASASPPAFVPPPKLDYLAGFLSYLIPGLGQIMQGRVAKGVVFFVCLYTMFFYGWLLGQRRNVYIPTIADRGGSSLMWDLYYRPHFVGQFFIGVAAWPAVWQYVNYDELKDEGPLFGKMMRAPRADEINRLQREESKAWDLGWVYTVIAGVLNILVIYDAIAGPAFRQVAPARPEPDPKKPQTATA